MALPKLTEDLAFISKLGDYPGSDNNLTPDQFREQFDAAALLIQKYLNDELIPGLDQIVDVEALLNGVVDKTLTQSGKAADAKVVGDKLSEKLSTRGGSMLGILDMSGRSITNVADPTVGKSAANKDYVDGKHILFTVTLYAANWSGEGPYVQTVSNSVIQKTDYPHYGLIYNGDTDAEDEAFSMIHKVETDTGTVTFTCFSYKPDIDITVQLEVNR